MKTEIEAIQSAIIQYRALFKAMACAPHDLQIRPCDRTPILTQRGAPVEDSTLEPFVQNVHAMTERTLANAVSSAYRKLQDSRDYGYLQHGTGTAGPFSSERVALRHQAPDIWQAHFEGCWRVVHAQAGRLFITYQGSRITIQIEGV